MFFFLTLSLAKLSSLPQRYIMKHRPTTPIFGICLGNQILALAAGASTYKMKCLGREKMTDNIELGWAGKWYLHGSGWVSLKLVQMYCILCTLSCPQKKQRILIDASDAIFQCKNVLFFEGKALAGIYYWTPPRPHNAWHLHLGSLPFGSPTVSLCGLQSFTFMNPAGPNQYPLLPKKHFHWSQRFYPPRARFGNRGMNQPVVDLRTQRCYITSQNHGFAVDQRTLPDGFPGVLGKGGITAWMMLGWWWWGGGGGFGFDFW